MLSATSDDMAKNNLLAILNDEDRLHLAPHFMAFDMKAGTVLQPAGEDSVDTWFPCGPALAAFCVHETDGEAVEIALVGREGAIGGIVSNGSLPAYATSQVRISGRFLRIKTAALEQAKLRSITLRHWFSRYSDCLLAQVFQTAACNATHTILQRTGKWLLSALDRTGDTEFTMTQEQLANMLGVSRTFISRVIRKLRNDGIIGTRRGVFIIRDLPALQQLSCSCNAAVANHFDTVLHGIYPKA
jgi:hypothetical protein